MKTLFVMHSASRSGAPLLLLDLVRWLVQHAGLVPTFLCREEGPLVGDFQALGEFISLPQYIGRKDSRGGVVGATARATIKRARLHRLKSYLDKRGFDLIYSNTATNGFTLDMLSSVLAPVLTHVHELGHSLASPGYLEAVRRTLGHTDLYVACAECVRASLCNQWAVPQERVRTVHSFVPSTLGSVDAGGRAALRQALGLPPTTKLVGAVGVASWRKGADLFLQFAAAVRAKASGANVHFVWLGGDDSLEMARNLRYDLMHAALDSQVDFVGEQADVRGLYSEFDLLVLPSREDPFPLVMLEAGMAQVPLLAFFNSGGAQEYIAHGGGRLVPYLDIDALANATIELLSDPAACAAAGRAGAAAVKNYFSLEVAAPRIFEAMIEAVSIGREGPKRRQ